jgi:acyl-CoA thioester hydrolase
VRVYWEDTDAGGIVFYANYLKFFERARTEWLRSLGVGQQALREATGAHLRRQRNAGALPGPARLDDELIVTVGCSEAGRASMTLAQQAWRRWLMAAPAAVRRHDPHRLRRRRNTQAAPHSRPTSWKP